MFAYIPPYLFKGGTSPFLYFGAPGSVGPTPIHPELGGEKAERT